MTTLVRKTLFSIHVENTFSGNNIQARAVELDEIAIAVAFFRYDCMFDFFLSF